MLPCSICNRGRADTESHALISYLSRTYDVLITHYFLYVNLLVLYTMYIIQRECCIYGAKIRKIFELCK